MYNNAYSFINLKYWYFILTKKYTERWIYWFPHKLQRRDRLCHVTTSKCLLHLFASYLVGWTQQNHNVMSLNPEIFFHQKLPEMQTPWARLVMLQLQKVSFNLDDTIIAYHPMLFSKGGGQRQAANYPPAPTPSWHHLCLQINRKRN